LRDSKPICKCHITRVLRESESKSEEEKARTNERKYERMRGKT